VKADFDNYKRRVEVQRAEQRAVAAMELVRELLPVLDACDAAVAQGHEDVAPVRSQLESTLAKRGLVKVAEVDVEFDPNIHEAVMHEEGDGDGNAVVVEVLRAGYLWNDHVVRPAMVKVKG
jgi:molecular chaperone GrpE